MSSDLYIDSTRNDDDSDVETIWIGHLGTCTYYGFHLTDKIHEYIHRNCLIYSPIDGNTSGLEYHDKWGGEYLITEHVNCNQPMTVEDVEALVLIFEGLYQHWQHLNSLTDEEFDALGYGYMRPTPEKVKEDIFSGEEIRDTLTEMVGLYWNTRCD